MKVVLLVAALLAVIASAPDGAELGIAGIHLFSFGGIARVADWADTVRTGP